MILECDVAVLLRSQYDSQIISERRQNFSIKVEEWSHQRRRNDDVDVLIEVIPYELRI